MFKTAIRISIDETQIINEINLFGFPLAIHFNPFLFEKGSIGSIDREIPSMNLKVNLQSSVVNRFFGKIFKTSLLVNFNLVKQFKPHHDHDLSSQLKSKFIIVKVLKNNIAVLIIIYEG